ncbi:phytanoyl-CoA dioxygenase family protein [Hahella ganghwensis]|uniref:phytanoyl-CoA dioxygenase family protein n=1 Tax=Hahella ganghwensis TaxID=286420 RepID=UPI00037C1F62|nr:phytanoyl-CoA dioxygenase family protein [Hahella ganghwensis]
MRNRYGFGNNAPGNNSVSNLHGTPFRELQKQLPLRVLSQEQYDSWIHQGYVIIPEAISFEDVKATQRFLWEFQEMSPTDPNTWYQPERRSHQMQELNNSGMVECYHHPLLWNNRQNPRVYKAFVDIWDREDLWVTIDRANLNPPNRQGREFRGFIHWDADTSLTPLPVNVQGVLALTNTDFESGGFQCVPGLYRDLEQWRTQQPANRDPYVPDLTGYEIEFIPLEAGDLLIFNALLPHGIRPNRSQRVRMAQYISMVPAEEDNQCMKEWRIRSWQNREAPSGYAFPGDPREWEKTRYPHAELTLLGEKLLGKTSWQTSF